MGKAPPLCALSGRQPRRLCGPKERRFGAQPGTAPSLGPRFQRPVSYIRYLRKMIWPSDLAAYYPHPGSWPWWAVLGACLVMLGITLFAVCQPRKPSGWLVVGWLWYLGTLVPVIGLVQVGTHALADRYSYLPSVGL